MTPEAQQRAASPEVARLRAVRAGRLPANGPEDMDLGDRCLVYRPVPVTSSGYNNHVQIAQTPDHVAIFQEQIHEVRIIPLDNRPHIPGRIRQWLGDSRAGGRPTRSSSRPRTSLRRPATEAPVSIGM